MESEASLCKAGSPAVSDTKHAVPLCKGQWACAGTRPSVDVQQQGMVRASHQDRLRAQRHGNEDAKKCKRNRPQQQLPSVQHHRAIWRVLLRRQLALQVSDSEQSAAAAALFPATGPCRCSQMQVWSPCTVSSRLQSRTMAGTTPTRPAASGMVAVATAVVWTITHSATVKSWPQPKRCSVFNSPNPRTAD